MLMTVILLAEDDGLTKLTKVEIPSSVVPGSLGIQFPPQSTLGAMRPVYAFYSKDHLASPCGISGVSNNSLFFTV